MNRNWLAFQRRIAMLLAADPRRSPTWTDRPRSQLYAEPPIEHDLDCDRAGTGWNSPRPPVPGIRRR